MWLHAFTSGVTWVSCSRSQLELSRALRHGALTCWKCPSEDGPLWSWRDRRGQQQHSGGLLHLNDAQLVLKGPTCSKKRFLTLCLHQIVILPSQCRGGNWDSSDQAICPLLVNPSKLLPQFCILCWREWHLCGYLSYCCLIILNQSHHPHLTSTYFQP